MKIAGLEIAEWVDYWTKATPELLREDETDPANPLVPEMKEAAAVLGAQLRLESGPRNPSIPHHAICLFKDGDKWCCVHGDFVNLQESPAGFGDTFDKAMDDLQRARKAESC